MLDQLQRNSQQLSQELLKQIQNKCEESLDQAVSVVNDRLLMQAALLKESGERLVENVQARLQEKLEAWSKAQLEAVQQQAGNVSADVLNQMRAESEAIAQHLDERLKSDTHLLETRVVEVMQEKLQKINAEFRSMVDRAFT